MENVPKLNPLVALAQPIEYISGFVTVQYNVPVDVVFASNAQLGGLYSTIKGGADFVPIFARYLTQNATGTDWHQ